MAADHVCRNSRSRGDVRADESVQWKPEKQQFSDFTTRYETLHISKRNIELNNWFETKIDLGKVECLFDD